MIVDTYVVMHCAISKGMLLAVGKEVVPLGSEWVESIMEAEGVFCATHLAF